MYGNYSAFHTAMAREITQITTKMNSNAIVTNLEIVHCKNWHLWSLFALNVSLA